MIIQNKKKQRERSSSLGKSVDLGSQIIVGQNMSSLEFSRFEEVAFG